jgi:hypothetical protein
VNQKPGTLQAQFDRLPPVRILTITLLLLATAAAQQATREAASAEPKMQLNFMNVCTPPVEEQKELAAALARIPAHPAFAVDMEVARGRSSMPEAPVSDWVRIRRDFPAHVPLMNVQYTFNVDEKAVTETLVFRVRDPRPGEILQISIDDSVTAGAPASVLAADTSAERVKLERYGKSSLALKRCPAMDQSVYEPLFRRASAALTEYRAALRVRQIVPADLARIQVAGRSRVTGIATPGTRPAHSSQALH